MTRACHDAVRKAAGDVFSNAEIDDFLDRLASRAQRKLKATPTQSAREAVAEAANELTKDELLASLTQRRADLAAKIARAARRAKLDAMPAEMNEAQRLRAFDVGSEKQGFATGASVDAEGRARSADLIGEVHLGIAQKPGLMNRICNTFGVGESEFPRLVAREMARLNGDGSIEPTGDEGALHVARVFNAGLERARQMQNGVGAWIDQQKGYIARQSHDRLKIAGGFWRELRVAADRAKRLDPKGALDWQALRQAAATKAFGDWRDFIKPKLDPKTFDGIDGNDVSITDARKFGDPLGPSASLADRFLYRVWFDIVTGAHEQLAGGDDLGDFRPPAGVASAVSRSRVLHFKDPDAWMDYNDRYGKGSLFAAVNGQLDRAGRNSALMKAYGPNPEAARAAEIDRLSSQARARGDPDAAKKLNSRWTEANFDALTGRLNAPENVRLAMIIRSFRTAESLAKLGSMVLSKTTDLPIAAHTFARVGGGFLGGYQGALKGITRLQSPEAKMVASLLHVGTRDFSSSMMGRWHSPDGPLGWGAWASRMQYKVEGFDFINDGVRSGMAVAFSHLLGLQSDRAYGELEIGTRETLQRFGIDEKAWDMARAGVEPAGDGLKYWTPETLDAVDDNTWHAWAGHETPASRTAESAQSAKDDLALRFTTMIHNVMDDAVSEPRAREQVSTTRGEQAGTVLGEFTRVMSQFHGFIRTILGRQLAPAMQGYAGISPAALMAHFVVSAILAGFLSMQAKQIVAGKTPRPLLNDNGTPDLKLWTAALAQGGGLGIYGDFLFGEQNRNGQPFSLDQLGGPTLSDAEQVAGIVYRSLHAYTTGTDQDRDKIAKTVPGELTQFATQHTPLVNLWYTRAALDYGIFWRMQEASNPGYLRRYEQRVKDKQGSDFWLQPTEYLGHP